MNKCYVDQGKFEKHKVVIDCMYLMPGKTIERLLMAS